MIKFWIIGAVLIVIVGIGLFSYPKNKSQANLPAPTPSVMATPTVTPTPTLQPTVKPTIKPTNPPAAASAGSYTCTLFLGYSQTNNWFPIFHGIMGNGYELKWQSGGAAHYWSDPGYAGWGQPISFPCAQNSDSPDRIVLDLTHDAYLNQTTADLPGIIRGWVSMTKQKYPSAKQIAVQPVTGGPNYSICTFSGDGLQVRASVNHSYIHQAIDQVVGGDVVKGNDSQVSSCSQYADSTGHLTGEGQSVVGGQNANFYK